MAQKRDYLHLRGSLFLFRELFKATCPASEYQRSKELFNLLKRELGIPLGIPLDIPLILQNTLKIKSWAYLFNSLIRSFYS